MSTTRQDAWSEDDDLLLAEVTLRHIREGGTQLSAFEEVGQRLGRTSAACGFRWNSLIRKKYDSAIQIAKAQRQQLKSTGKKRFVPEMNEAHRMQDLEVAREMYTQPKSLQSDSPSYAQDQMTQAYTDYSVNQLSYDDVIRFLRKQKDSSKRIKQVDHQLKEKDHQIAMLRQENEQVKRELQSTQGINEDYQALVKIMDRARKMAFLATEDEQEDKISFKMDKNGNLERVEKEV